jgi:hypothetical protein
LRAAFLKTFGCTLAVLVLIVAVSPFISLVLPDKYTKHTYYRLLYRAIVEKQTSCLNNSHEKAERLFGYVVEHTFAQSTPRSAKPAESLISAEAYCDYQAQLLNALLGVAGIQSRYAMLLNADGLSVHTLNEVYLGSKWAVFDPTWNMIYRDAQGDYLSLEQLSVDPGLIWAQRKLALLRVYDDSQYEDWVSWFKQMFPCPRIPQRSIPRIQQYHLLDFVADAYFRLFKEPFFCLYQDLYLKLKKKSIPQDDTQLLFWARNYHLGYRFAEAGRLYREVLKRQPDSAYLNGAFFFAGVLAYDTRDYEAARVYFQRIVDSHHGRWIQAAYYYLGKVYEETHADDASLEACRNANMLKLSAQVLEELVGDKE